mmetsp:Transcript_7178/g.11846  ORF Transcript_7178/g.11846 Transcript_7178/m.11846 type:complete len:140 (-) Transcript_7178:51-470(-)
MMMMMMAMLTVINRGRGRIGATTTTTSPPTDAITAVIREATIVITIMAIGKHGEGEMVVVKAVAAVTTGVNTGEVAETVTPGGEMMIVDADVEAKAAKAATVGAVAATAGTVGTGGDSYVRGNSVILFPLVSDKLCFSC